MTLARSIHVGLNAVDPQAYGGWAGRLLGCENDARAMRELAGAQGFEPMLLRGADATRDRLLAAIAEAAAAMVAGDQLLLTYSGHGASLGDRSGDEPDGRDEVWCLRDGLLLDDELHERLCAIAAGVRVLVVSDSCFSGSVTRDDRRRLVVPEARRRVMRSGELLGAERRLRSDRARSIVRAHAPEYEARKAALTTTAATPAAASVVLLAACADHETARDGAEHGVFTQAILDVWDRGAFAGDHEAFHAAIVARVTGQHPQLYTEGPRDEAFVRARPFTP